MNPAEGLDPHRSHAAQAVRDGLTEADVVVVKVGSRLIAAAPDRQGMRPQAGMDPRFFWRLAADLAECCGRGHRPVLVSSGAIAIGRAELGWQGGERSMAREQAAAAVGQCGLVQRYRDALGDLGLRVAQVLLTHDDLEEPTRRQNARATLRTLLDQRVIPVINENDTVAVEEIRFGDNDLLSARVTELVSADLLILLSTVAGLHARDPVQHPDIPPIPVLAPGDVDPEVSSVAGALGKGGGASKLQAARTVAKLGVPAIVADGRLTGIVSRLLSGEALGTLVLPGEPRTR